ncbi:MAG: AbrB/MazE/SpoVT family DNA-binding domain-containing protein [Rhodocyclales bacterium]|nr:AbrB/MazE/SpoVT family DNA-binding domain-containing protein [Rhodocyclales bacterium]
MKAQVISDENGQAVRIPEGLTLPGDTSEVDIQAIPGGLLIRLNEHRKLRLSEIFARFPPGFMAAGREQDDEEERDWGWAKL